MGVQPALLLIADIAGYTRFMNFHKASVIHAQDVVAQLLEAMIDATTKKLTLAKLEGDAAFFYVPFASSDEPRLDFVLEQVAAIYRAFHRKASDLAVNTLCPCDGCTQAGDLKIKLVGHFGSIARQKIKNMTELAGVDVILVHRLLKNGVPIPEYLLMTDPLFQRVDASVRDRAASLQCDVDELGKTDTFYLDLQRYVAEVPAAPRLPLIKRLERHMKLIGRTLPFFVGMKKACVGFQNVPDAL